MRFAVIGAGAVGGYFGGRLVQAGQDVTFIVRSRRRRQLEDKGLVIQSPDGNWSGPVKAVESAEGVDADVVLLTVKAYDAEGVWSNLDPLVQRGAAVLPLLNGVRHMDILRRRYGDDAVIGGLCHVESYLDDDGVIHRSSRVQDITFGEWSGVITPRIEALDEAFRRAGIGSHPSSDIEVALWDKYAFITAVSGTTALTGAGIGVVLGHGSSRAVFQHLVEEAVTTARARGISMPDDAVETVMRRAEGFEPGMLASMAKDLQAGRPVEIDHLQGALVEMAREYGVPAPVHEVVYGLLTAAVAGRSVGGDRA
ncbi:ketopantoate reductase family protein [Kyrpidia spormannii]|uniref:2-dehydropantoate 2-reductase n=2 Tax=Kyrpidia spormannii TaxID=2055160 RepID=A0ACA8ZD01_9BACL|nr:ketopantoate reductase family protein [Kyrpidia spormannii]CAB3395220.1 2-dehydropantoate 2-reductase [Kyrpidia spormannii]CAB3396037.1 2-dehydropantoate 2-reductase [Kyrpidia spormannii]